MKKILFLVVCFVSLKALSIPIEMPRVDVKLFVNKGSADFDRVELKDKEAKLEGVKWLFENNQLNHDLSQAVALDAKFQPYWEVFSENWFFIDMDNDGQGELVFSGKNILSDDKERLYIYAKYGSVWKQIFWDQGHLMAYKIHPNTGEVILYHHKYPCCRQYTHTIQRLRWLGNKLHSNKRHFLARETEMNGQLFPKKSFYPTIYRQLKENTMLYWSKGIIKKDAAFFSPTNQIIHFPALSYYQILAREGNWKYVMMVSPPIIEQSMVANANNLQKSRFYGWLRN